MEKLLVEEGSSLKRRLKGYIRWLPKHSYVQYIYIRREHRAIVAIFTAARN